MDERIEKMGKDFRVIMSRTEDMRDGIYHALHYGVVIATGTLDELDVLLPRWQEKGINFKVSATREGVLVKCYEGERLYDQQEVQDFNEAAALIAETLKDSAL